MFHWFEPAAIFLGAIGGTAIILIAIYFCIKSEKCFCDVKGTEREDTPDVDYVQVATEDHGSDDGTIASTVPLKKSIQAVSAPNISTSGGPVWSSDEENAPGVSTIGEAVDDSGITKLKPPPSGTRGSKKEGSLSEKITRRSQGNIHLALQYSKKDLFLFVIIHNVTDLDPRIQEGIDQVRISTVLLPAKKNRSKTKFMPINDPKFEAHFKFANVSREDLFQSAMRFRLYGRHVKLGMHIGKEKLLGEVTVHLADVAQKDRITTSRPLWPPMK